MAILAGVHRAEVVSNEDPLERGRLLVRIPELGAGTTVWALACVASEPLRIPRPGSEVWVAFEAGDSSKPVWLGSIAREPASGE